MALMEVTEREPLTESERELRDRLLMRVDEAKRQRDYYEQKVRAELEPWRVAPRQVWLNFEIAKLWADWHARAYYLERKLEEMGWTP